MAFIMGIYQELIEAIKSFNVELLKKAVRFDIKGVFEQVPWRFLLALGSGIAFSILTLAHAVIYALEHHQAYLYAFFFGLVLASIVAVGAGMRWSANTIAGLVIGTLVSYWIVGPGTVHGSQYAVGGLFLGHDRHLRHGAAGASPVDSFC